jgi:GT2 family glycosyltransferase
MTASSPSVGIGILNWNGKKFLEKLLPELQSLTYPNYTLYIIDNNSSDDSVSFIKANHPEIRLIILDDNYGFAGGYNRGFAEMKEDYYLMMNSDVEVPTDFIEPMVKMMEEDKSIAVCQPKLLNLLQPEFLEHGGAAGGMIDFLAILFAGDDYLNLQKKIRDSITNLFLYFGPVVLVALLEERLIGR